MSTKPLPTRSRRAVGSSVSGEAGSAACCWKSQVDGWELVWQAGGPSPPRPTSAINDPARRPTAVTQPPPLRGTSCISCRCRTGRDRCGRPWARGGAPGAPRTPRALRRCRRSLLCAAAPPPDSIVRRGARLRCGCGTSTVDAGLLAAQLHVEQLLADVAADDPHHLAEDHEAFLLVLLLGILLAVAAQADALAQRLHRLQVIDPALVDLLEVEVAREVQEDGQRELRLARLDHLLQLVPQLLDQHLAVEELVDARLETEALLDGRW